MLKRLKLEEERAVAAAAAARGPPPAAAGADVEMVCCARDAERVFAERVFAERVFVGERRGVCASTQPASSPQIHPGQTRCGRMRAWGACCIGPLHPPCPASQSFACDTRYVTPAGRGWASLHWPSRLRGRMGTSSFFKTSPHLYPPASTMLAPPAGGGRALARRPVQEDQGAPSPLLAAAE